MQNQKFKTKVVHSLSKSAWNVVAENPLGSKYKLARVPYVTSDDQKICDMNRNEALVYAEFISHCFNNYYDTFVHNMTNVDNI